MSERWIEEWRRYAKEFPKGSTVQLKSDIHPSETTQVRQGVVKDVVVTGVHRDVFLKFRDSQAYGNPEAYMLVESSNG